MPPFPTPDLDPAHREPDMPPPLPEPTPSEHAFLPPPHDDPSRWVPRLTQILDEECRVCRQLEALGASQGALIRDGDTDSLLRVIAERQELIDRISLLSEQIEPFRRQWESLLGRVPGPQRKVLQDCVSELASLVERIGQRDDEDRAALERRRAAVSDELVGVSRSRGALAAYANRNAPARAHFQDRNG